MARAKKALYGEGAVEAVDSILKEGKDPLTAWKDIMWKKYRNSKHAREKSCPKGAFLGLCEEGCIKGIEKQEKGTWIEEDNVNKNYAIKAIEKLKEDESFLDRKNELWPIVSNSYPANPNNPVMRHNNQLDVVFDLWNDKKIKR